MFNDTEHLYSKHIYEFSFLLFLFCVTLINKNKIPDTVFNQIQTDDEDLLLCYEF